MADHCLEVLLVASVTVTFLGDSVTSISLLETVHTVDDLCVLLQQGGKLLLATHRLLLHTSHTRD